MTHLLNATAKLDDIRTKILQSCQRSKRRPEDVCLIGASKYQPIEIIKSLACAGLRDFGENYEQELNQKCQLLEASDPDLAKKVHWHFIGSLQRRKVRKLVGSVTYFHSLDRLELAQELDRRATEPQTIKALIQVNLGAESSKGGLLVDDAEEFLRACCRFKQLSIVGLMILPPWSEDPEESRRYFRQVRELRDAINQRAVYKEPLRELSMGMSHDFQTAIEEGATMIRVGTALFGERKH